ncbi:dentin sialophosphoprotein-like isoform X6 [Halichondria panicea]|uniref:dentin sialophosphoprotein-like isoform X6 n=1 Tax=Halichondria panicea TaxID=6063 RepID=UPI00312B88ED
MASSSAVRITQTQEIPGYVTSKGPAGFKAVCKTTEGTLVTLTPKKRELGDNEKLFENTPEALETRKSKAASKVKQLVRECRENQNVCSDESLSPPPFKKNKPQDGSSENEPLPRNKRKKKATSKKTKAGTKNKESVNSQDNNDDPETSDTSGIESAGTKNKESVNSQDNNDDPETSDTSGIESATSKKTKAGTKNKESVNSQDNNDDPETSDTSGIESATSKKTKAGTKNKESVNSQDNNDDPETSDTSGIESATSKKTKAGTKNKESVNSQDKNDDDAISSSGLHAPETSDTSRNESLKSTASSSPVRITQTQEIPGYVTSKGPAGFKAVCKTTEGTLVTLTPKKRELGDNEKFFENTPEALETRKSKAASKVKQLVRECRENQNVCSDESLSPPPFKKNKPQDGSSENEPLPRNKRKKKATSKKTKAGTKNKESVNSQDNNDDPETSDTSGIESATSKKTKAGTKNKESVNSQDNNDDPETSDTSGIESVSTRVLIVQVL